MPTGDAPPNRTSPIGEKTPDGFGVARRRASPFATLNGGLDGILALVSLITVLVFGPAHTHDRFNPATKHPAPIRRRSRACSNADPVQCIIQAARRYHQPVEEAERVAYCESSDNPSASNGQDFGLWQFLPSTFSSTPYRAHSYWSAKWSSLAAMWMWSHGQQHQWECWTKLYG